MAEEEGSLQSRIVTLVAPGAGGWWIRTQTWIIGKQLMRRRSPFLRLRVVVGLWAPSVFSWPDWGEDRQAPPVLAGVHTHIEPYPGIQEL